MSAWSEAVDTGPLDMQAGQSTEVQKALEVLATGETDPQDQMLEIVATGETDLEAREATAGRVMGVGALVGVEGGTWRFRDRAGKNEKIDVRQ